MKISRREKLAFGLGVLTSLLVFSSFHCGKLDDPRGTSKGLADYLPSMEHHSIPWIAGGSQISLKDEMKLGAAGQLPTTYHDIPTTQDDEGSAVNIASHNGTTCGSSGSIEDRIADCAAKNPKDSFWDGTTLGNAGHGPWRLVVKTSPSLYEVWRDERTGLLWSDVVSTTETWCTASGNSDQAVCPGNTTSSCTNDNVNLESKGSLSQSSTPRVRWRLPSRYDWELADVNGFRFIIRSSPTTFWTSTIASTLTTAFSYSTVTLGILAVGGTVNTLRPIYCVGRY